MLYHADRGRESLEAGRHLLGFWVQGLVVGAHVAASAAHLGTHTLSRGQIMLSKTSSPRVLELWCEYDLIRAIESESMSTAVS